MVVGKRGETGKGDWIPVAGIKPEIRTLPFSSKHMDYQ